MSVDTQCCGKYADLKQTHSEGLSDGFGECIRFRQCLSDEDLIQFAQSR